MHAFNFSILQILGLNGKVWVQGGHVIHVQLGSTGSQLGPIWIAALVAVPTLHTEIMPK